MDKWSYTNMDKGDTKPQDITHNNCQPALVIWALMTTSAKFKSGQSQPLTCQELSTLSDRTGLTVTCIENIINMANQAVPDMKGPSGISANVVRAAFDTVIAAFSSVGFPNAYPPSDCPGVNDLTAIATAAGSAPSN